MVQFSKYSLVLLLEKVAELSALQVLCRTGRLRPYLSRAEAFRVYGRRNVLFWINAGLLDPGKDGDHSAPWRIDRVRAEALKSSEDLLLFIGSVDH